MRSSILLGNTSPHLGLSDQLISVSLCLMGRHTWWRQAPNSYCPLISSPLRLRYVDLQLCLFTDTVRIQCELIWEWNSFVPVGIFVELFNLPLEQNSAHTTTGLSSCSPWTNCVLFFLAYPRTGDFGIPIAEENRLTEPTRLEISLKYHVQVLC